MKMVQTDREVLEKVDKEFGGNKDLKLGFLQELVYKYRDNSLEQRNWITELMRELEVQGEWRRIEALISSALLKYPNHLPFRYYAAIDAERHNHWSIADAHLVMCKTNIVEGKCLDWEGKVRELEDRIHNIRKGNVYCSETLQELLPLLPRMAAFVDRGANLHLKAPTSQLYDFVLKGRVVWVADEPPVGVPVVNKATFSSLLPEIGEPWIPTLPIEAWMEARKLVLVLGSDLKLITIPPANKEPAAKYAQIGGKDSKVIGSSVDLRFIPYEVQLALVYMCGLHSATKGEWLYEANASMRLAHKKEKCKEC